MEGLIQLIIGAFVVASELALLAAGFGLIFYVTQTFHFVHGAVFLAGGYGAVVASNWLGIPVVFSLLLGVLTAVLFGVCTERFLYRPFRRIGATHLAIFIVSLGALIILESVYEIIFGAEASVISNNFKTRIYTRGLIVFTNIDCLAVGLALFACLAVIFYLHYSPTGRLIRAVANNPELAETFGIESSRFFLLAFAIGSGMAGLAGCIHIIRGGLSPLMGAEAVLFGAIIAFLSGIGKIGGAALGAFLLAVCMNLGIWKLPGQWQHTIAFGVLFLVMILKPEGVFAGRKS
ncbi:MAG: branched-chain amino acid ABC transporter permease [Pseudomonadota bacterium]